MFIMPVTLLTASNSNGSSFMAETRFSETEQHVAKNMIFGDRDHETRSNGSCWSSIVFRITARRQ